MVYLFKIDPDRDKMINNQWQEVIKESDHLSWDLLTNENTIENDAATDTDSDENIEGIGALKNKQTKEKESHPTIMHNVDGLNIRPKK